MQPTKAHTAAGDRIFLSGPLDQALMLLVECDHCRDEADLPEGAIALSVALQISALRLQEVT